MTYSLVRVSDGAGDSGPMSMAMRLSPTGIGMEFEHNARPTVGWAIRVGSMAARTYAAQDWWQTTIISEILEESDNFVRFKTTNSEYEWKVI